mmetsp:Transcript_34195/g.114112  ORF Transcript_34195/g.114112 Transcript_34195/m.114112 type:complete len:229 (-) Transcript_34195:186-872(-)
MDACCREHDICCAPGGTDLGATRGCNAGLARCLERCGEGDGRDDACEGLISLGMSAMHGTELCCGRPCPAAVYTARASAALTPVLAPYLNYTLGTAKHVTSHLEEGSERVLSRFRAGSRTVHSAARGVAESVTAFCNDTLATARRSVATAVAWPRWPRWPWRAIWGAHDGHRSPAAEAAAEEAAAERAGGEAAAAAAAPASVSSDRRGDGWLSLMHTHMFARWGWSRT